jgi:UDP-4-amino-4,6-dideoxy-N-acetyl-beta-L-altrosamine transaminase
MIPYGKQWVSDEDIAAAVEVLKSDFLTQGPEIDRFERAVAEYCGVEHAVAVSNGTAALHVACMAAGLGPGDLLWTSPITFAASANCGRYVGADVDFVDIEPATLNMDVDALAAKLAVAEAEGRLPKMVVPVDFGGLSCDMRRIRELANRYGFLILEDAAHALGGRYLGEPVGSCRFSDMAMFSFHPVKSITTGEGGMIVTNDSVLADRMRLLRTHGITRDPSLMRGESEGGWYYEQVELGFNMRITDIQCALGRSQMARLDGFVSKRNELAERYRELLADLPLRWQSGTSDAYSAHHLFVVRLDDAKSRSRVFDEMRNAGVNVNVHYIPVHLQPYYRDLGFAQGDLPNAEAYYAGALTLPLYPSMSERDQDAVVAALRASSEQSAEEH